MCVWDFVGGGEGDPLTFLPLKLTGMLQLLPSGGVVTLVRLCQVD